jgi:peroxiredoxin
VTSQSPDKDEATDDYRAAWASLREMVANQGASWSGRESNHLFMNLGGKSFADISYLSSADFKDDGRGAITLDWDNDGRQDLLLRSRTAPRLRLLRNQSDNPGHFLTLDLQGVNCNRDAIGASVEIETKEFKTCQTLHAGDSFLSQSSKALHFGLGANKVVQKLTVTWPDGSTDQYADLAADQRYRIVQGATEPALVHLRTNQALARVQPQTLPRQGQTVVRIPLLEKIPLQEMPIPSFDNPNRRVKDLAGRPVLLNLWGMTCSACMKEFQAFERRKKQIDGRGLRIVTLTTDPVDKHDAARKLMTGLGLRADAGYTTDIFLTALESMLFEILGASPGSPLPTSLLLDERGNLVVVYQGKVPVGEMLRDVALSSSLAASNSNGSALFFGVQLKQARRNFQFLANTFRSYGWQDQARIFEALAVSGKGQQPVMKH